jgi:hypothetical protein
VPVPTICQAIWDQFLCNCVLDFWQDQLDRWSLADI